MSRALFSLSTRRYAASLLAAALVVAGGIVVVAPATPAQAAGAPIVIDDFSGTTIGTRTVTNNPTRDSTSSQGTFTQANGVGTMVSHGNGNTVGNTTLEYTLAGPTDLTAGGNNKQFFLEFNSIHRAWTDPATENDLAAIIGVEIFDSSGRRGNFSTGIINTLGQNIVLNWVCDAGGACFSGNADFTKTSRIVVTVSSPTNYAPNRPLTTELNIIRTTPLGGVQPPAPRVGITPVSSTVMSVDPKTVSFDVAFFADGAAREVSGFDASDVTVSGTAGPLSPVTVTGGPSEYVVTVGPVATSGTVKLDIAANAVTDTWGQKNVAGGTSTAANFVRAVAPVITSANSSTFTVGVAKSFSFTASGNPASTFAVTGGGPLPSGLSLSSAGVLSGTAAAGSATTKTLEITATNFAGTNKQNFTLVVNQKPAITSSASATFTYDTVTPFSITTTGSPTPTVTGSGTLPAGLTFTAGANGTATITGKPTTWGDFTYDLSASNGVDPVATQTLAIRVLRAPFISDPEPRTVQLGSAVTFVAIRGGYPAPTLQWQRLNGTTWTNVAGATDPAWTWTPTKADNGLQVRFIATNSSGSVTSAATSLTVQSTPTITSASSTVFVTGGERSFLVTADGIPTPVITTSTLPSWLRLTTNPNGSATLVGTPPVSATGTTVLVDLTATNGIGTAATQQLAITIHRAPAVETNPQNRTVEPGTVVTLTAAAVGYPVPSVQWQKAATPSDGFANIAGATSTELIFTAAESGNGARYRALFVNTEGATATTAATVRVGTAPVITSANTTRFTSGQPGSFAISATQGAALSIASLPSWLSLTPTGAGSATLAGTAPAGVAGPLTFTVVANNTFDPNATQLFTLVVDASPSFTSATSAVFRVGQAGSTTITTSQGYPVARAISIDAALPAGLTFTDNGDGTATIAGTPAAGSGASYTRTLTAKSTGGTSSSVTQSLTITVNEQPAITSAASDVFVAGEASAFTVTTSAGYPSATTLSVTGTLPAGIQFTDNGDGTATLSGTAARSAAGAYPLVISAGNGVGSAVTKSFRLAVNTSPVITSDDAVTFEVGDLDEFDIVAEAGFPTATTVTVDGTLPVGLVVTYNGDGTATLTGTARAGSGGTYALTVTAQAAGGTTPNAVQHLTITVNEQARFSSANSTTFVAGMNGSFTVTTQPGFPVARALAVTGTLPDGVTFMDNGDGTATIAGTPTVAAAGSYDLGMTVDNGVGSAPSSDFTLRVDTPATFRSAGSATLDVATAADVTITTAAGFPVARTISVEGTLPAGIQFSDSGDGTAHLTGTPAAGAGGSYPLTVSVQTVGGTTPATTQSFELVVRELAAISSADATTFLLGAASSFTVATSQGYPVSRALTVTGELPDGVSFVDQGDGTAVLSGTPTETGTFVLDLTSSNYRGASATQRFTLTVNTSPTITSEGDSTFVVGVGGSVEITATAGNPAVTTLRVDGTLPTGLTFTDHGDGTASLAGAAAIGSAGSYPVTFVANNGATADDSVSGTITVTDATAVPLPATVPAATGDLEGVPARTTETQEITVSGEGFAPGAPITVGMYSTPRALGTATADATGAFTLDVTLPKLTGAHTLVATGIDGAGAPAFLTAQTTVAALPSSLAITGTDGAVQALWLGALLLVIGLAVRGVRRTRRA